MTRKVRYGVGVVAGLVCSGVVVIVLGVLHERSQPSGDPDLRNGVVLADRQPLQAASAGSPELAPRRGPNRSDSSRSTPIESSVVATAGAHPTTEEPLDESVVWEQTYRDASITDLEFERDNLIRYIAFRTNDDFNRMFSSGQYLRLREGDTVVPSDMDPETLSRIQVNKDVFPPEIRRATLSEDQFPELYSTWRQMRWLDREATARRRVAKEIADVRALELYSKDKK